MPPRLLVAAAALALLGTVALAARALTRPAEEATVPAVRLDSQAPRPESGRRDREERAERSPRPRGDERSQHGGFAPPSATPPAGAGADDLAAADAAAADDAGAADDADDAPEHDDGGGEDR